jgi:hypothetical protein
MIFRQLRNSVIIEYIAYHVFILTYISYSKDSPYERLYIFSQYSVILSCILYLQIRKHGLLKYYYRHVHDDYKQYYVLFKIFNIILYHFISIMVLISSNLSNIAYCYMMRMMTEIYIDVLFYKNHPVLP